VRHVVLCAAALALAALLSPPSALGQESPQVATTEQAPATLNEVEHGLYAGASIGALVLYLPGTGSGVGVGTLVSATLGYDFTPFIGMGFFAWGLALSTPSNYQGLGANPTASGDLTGIFPGLELVLHLPLSADRNDVDRLFFNVAAGGGALFLNPGGLVGTKGTLPAGMADLSLEYFTHLRHFSLGVALDGLAAFPSGGNLIGGALSLFARYSF
jgi:hypothetical protein